MESESSRAERLRLESPEDRELIAPVEIETVEVGGSGGDEPETGRCSGVTGWGSVLDCGGICGGGVMLPLGPSEIGRLAMAPKDCCDGRKAFVPLT